MRSCRSRPIWLAAFCVMVWAGPAWADFWAHVASTLSDIANPRGGGMRSGSFVFSYEPFMDGWRVDFQRTFGPDAYGRPNRLDFGPIDLTFNSGSLVWSGQFNRRLLPAAEFTFSTPTPIDYTLTVNTGFQDARVDGQILVDSAGHMNILGFYDYELTVSNRGEFATDGFGPEDDGNINFDIGPINVSGNIFADILAIVTDPFFTAAGTENPFAKFSQQATKQAYYDATADALRERMAAGETLTDEEIEALIQATVLSAVLGAQPDASLIQQALLQRSLAEEGDTGSAGVNRIIPEPVSVALLGAGILLAAGRRRRF